MKPIFDSVAEEQFYAQHQHYLLNPTNRYFPDTFVDSEGTPFRACFDFITHDGIYVEFKARQLNTSKTKAIAEALLENRLRWSKPNTENFQRLEYAWNHSINKHSIIAQEYGSSYLIVFKDGTELSAHSKNKMNSSNINWCFESFFHSKVTTFQLVAAMNPTPGGYSPDDPRSQRYSREQMQRYLSRLSGPFLDRMDLHIEVPMLPREMLTRPTEEEPSAIIQQRVIAAWQRQMARQGCANAELSGKALDRFGGLQTAERTMLETTMDKLNLSARAYHRILRVARTIADLRDQPNIDKSALIEALNCRQLEKLLKPF